MSSRPRIRRAFRGIVGSPRTLGQAREIVRAAERKREQGKLETEGRTPSGLYVIERS